MYLQRANHVSDLQIGFLFTLKSHKSVKIDKYTKEYIPKDHIHVHVHVKSNYLKSNDWVIFNKMRQIFTNVFGVWWSFFSIDFQTVIQK